MSWAGATPHFRTVGLYQGEEVDLSIDGTSAADPAVFFCSREYQAPLVNGELDLAHAKLRDIKLHGIVTVNGERRGFEVEFKRHDFRQSPVGSVIAVIPRDDTAEPGPGQMWFEWEWHDAVTGDTLDERAAQEGSFTLGEFTGEPDENGIIPDGTGVFGGFIRAKWTESESVALTFTANCGENEIESNE